MCDGANDCIAASAMRHNHDDILDLFLGFTVLVLVDNC
jgi:hypothetical protein